MARHLKMLCVDDKEDLRDALAQQFSNEDFDVDTADDGDIALQMILGGNYDIVLLDIKMPRMDGLTVLQELKKANKNPYVIMLTGVNEVAIAEECVKMGAKDFVSKPYDPEELLHVVIKVLGS